MVLGAILNGGYSRRMGCNKSEVLLQGKPLLDWAVEGLSPQVDRVVIIGGSAQEAAERGVDYCEDAIPGGRGPLAGILSAMKWAGSQGGAKVFVCAVDTPFLPEDLVNSLSMAAPNAEVIFPQVDGQVQYLCGLWRADLEKPLRAALQRESVSSVRDFAKTVDFEQIEMDVGADEDSLAFANLNTPAEVEKAEQWLTSHKPGR